MNPEKQRIAIAEACGIVSKDKWGSLYKTPRGILRDCPDYLNDLNAMHEAEKVLACTDEGPKTSERRRYLMILEAVIAGPPDRFGDRPNRQLSTPFATAAQRAEAFLRTINKWEEL